MNDIVAFQSKSLVPANIGQAMELAKMMSDSSLVPSPLQKKPADCLLVIEQAMRWGMSPFAVAQSTSVIHGKLMYEGKLVAAVVNANGGLERRLSYSYSGEAENRKITVSGLVRGETEPRTVDVVFKDVKTTSEQWKKQPDQQLMYSGARVWARRHMPELMLGVYTVDEDIPDNRAQAATAVPIEPVAVMSSTAETIDSITGEITEAKFTKVPHTINLETKNEKKDWIGWGTTYAAELRGSGSIDVLTAWVTLNESAMKSCSVEAPMIHERLMNIIDAERKKMAA